MVARVLVLGVLGCLAEPAPTCTGQACEPDNVELLQVKFGADLLNQAQHALACAKEETSVGCDDVRSAKLRNVLARTQPDELSVPYSLSQRTSGSIAVVSVCFPDRTPYAQNRNREDTTESWAQICKAAKENFQAYCSRHGYRLFFMDHKPAKGEGRPAAYAKVLAIQHALRAPEVEAAFYMDADSLFMNFEKDLDSLLPSGDKQVTISGDRNCWLNSGHIMFKSSKWTAKFLKETWGIWPPPEPWTDQGAFIYQLSDLPPAQREQCREVSTVCCAGPVIKEADRRKQEEMNSYYGDFRAGDFICHFVDRPAQEKADLMTKYADRAGQVKAKAELMTEYGKRAAGLVTMQQLQEFHAHLTT